MHQDQEEVVRQIRLGYKVNANMENKCGLNVDVAGFLGELYVPMFIPGPQPQILHSNIPGPSKVP